MRSALSNGSDIDCYRRGEQQAMLSARFWRAAARCATPPFRPQDIFLLPPSCHRPAYRTSPSPPSSAISSATTPVCRFRALKSLTSPPTDENPPAFMSVICAMLSPPIVICYVTPRPPRQQCRALLRAARVQRSAAVLCAVDAGMRCRDAAKSAERNDKGGKERARMRSAARVREMEGRAPSRQPSVPDYTPPNRHQQNEPAGKMRDTTSSYVTF